MIMVLFHIDPWRITPTSGISSCVDDNLDDLLYTSYEGKQDGIEDDGPFQLLGKKGKYDKVKIRMNL